MICSIGVDTAEVERFQKLWCQNKERLFGMLFSAAELASMPELSERRAVGYIAGRWAAKEAVLKALGTGMGPVSLPEVEIHTHSSGQPFVQLLGRATTHSQQLGIRQFHLSITHTSTTATAFVIAEG